MKHPSFFSRLCETADAFRNVTDDLRSGHRSATDQEYRIVQECLDVMELLYVQDERVEVVTISWGEIEGSQQADSLSRHMPKLILDDAAPLFSIDSARGIGIILMEGKVIGGLSPLTLVYSKPGTLDGIHDNAWNLSSRRYSFIRYLYSLAAERMLPEVLRDYVMASLRDHMDLIRRLQGDHQKLDSLDIMKDRDGVEVQVNCYPIYRNTADNMVAGSGYMLRSSKAMASGSERLPLVLSPSGIPGASYVGDLRWNPDYMKSRDSRPIQDRTLPATGLRYPYVTVEDFLADRIIECDSNPGQISHLYLYRVDDNHYVVLPLRQIFFDYFTIEDVVNLLSIDYIGNCYHVCLDVPVQAEMVRFHKVYGQEEIEVLNLGHDFNMAISPFLATDDIPRHIISFQNHCECMIRFFNSECNAETSSETVHSELNFSYGMDMLVFTKTEQPWDYMIMTVSRQDDEEAEGIIIPRFVRPMTYARKECMYSIIVNDRNVSILQTDSTTGHMEPLVFVNNSMPVCAMADTPMFEVILRRCFICMDHDTERHRPKSMIRIPLTVNVIGALDYAEMLGGCNIAFNPCDPVPNHGRQIRNLFSKNNVLDNRKAERMFCKEIAYLIRLSSIEKGLDSLPTVRVEVPLWMSNTEKEEYRYIWRSAFSAAGINRDNIMFVDCHAMQFECNKNNCPPPGEIIHVDVDAYHTVLARAGSEFDSIDYRIYDFGINNLYGVVEPFHSLHENAYIRQIVGSGQRDSELMNMVEQHKDGLDILERALKINDHSCLEVQELLLPYALFIGALADAIIDFAAESGLVNMVGVMLTGDGLRLLCGVSSLRDPSRTLQSLIINKGRFDNIAINVHMVQKPEYHTDMYCHPHYVPKMIEYQTAGVQDVDLTQDEVCIIIEQGRLRMLDYITCLADSEWLDGILLERGFTSLRTATKESLPGLFETSYMRCAHDYIHSNLMNDQLQVPDMRFWPYFYSLSRLALDGYNRSPY